jgi:hypothetical protein
MSLPICPTGCIGNLAPISLDICSPTINDGEIRYVYYTSIGYPMQNIASELEWDGRIDNTSTAAGKIRALTVTGEFPRAAESEKTISGGRIVPGARDFQLNLTVDETNAANYQSLVRSLACGQKVLMWFETSGKLLFGGNEGIEATPIFDLVIPTASTDLITFQGGFKWKARFHPEGYIVSPIKADTGNR